MKASPQRQFAQTVNEVGSQLIMANEKSHVDGTVERIENQIHVHIPPELAAEDPTAQRGIGFLTPRLQEAFAKSCDQIVVALSGAQHGRDGTPTAAKQYLY